MKKSLLFFILICICLITIKYRFSNYNISYKVDNYNVKTIYKNKRFYYEIYNKDRSFNFDIYNSRKLSYSKINNI